MNYKTLDKQLSGRCKNSRKIANNTYLKRRDKNIAILLHKTDIATFKKSPKTKTTNYALRLAW